jgi:hypothetical protein
MTPPRSASCRAPRLRTLGSIEAGKQLQMTTDACRLMFGRADVKTGKRIDYELPPELFPFICRYLEVERRELLQRRNHDMLWVAPPSHSPASWP